MREATLEQWCDEALAEMHNGRLGALQASEIGDMMRASRGLKGTDAYKRLEMLQQAADRAVLVDAGITVREPAAYLRERVRPGYAVQLRTPQGDWAEWTVPVIIYAEGIPAVPVRMDGEISERFADAYAAAESWRESMLAGGETGEIVIDVDPADAWAVLRVNYDLGDQPGALGLVAGEGEPWDFAEDDATQIVLSAVDYPRWGALAYA